MAGFDDQDAIWLATIPAGTNFLFTIVSLFLVERIGRRKLLIGSISGVIFSLLLLSATFLLMDHFSLPSRPLVDSCSYQRCGSCVGNSECGFCVAWDVDRDDYVNGTCSPILALENGTAVSKYRRNGTCVLFGELVSDPSLTDLGDPDMDVSMLGSGSGIGPPPASAYRRHWYQFQCPGNALAPLAVVALILYIATFAPGFGPLPWTVNSEIYPTWARSTAISIATMCNWASNLFVSMTFLTLADALGQPATFGLYASLSFLGLMFVVFFVPETRRRSLEEVESLFQRPHFMNWFRKY